MSHTVSPLIGRLIWPLMMRRIFGPQATPERFREDFPVWMALRPSQLRASSAELALMIPAAMSLRERYHELLLPVAIVAGDSDRSIDTQQQSERLHRELPQSSLHIVRDGGHMVHHQAPQEVMAAIDHAATAEGAVPRQYQHVFPAPAQII
jgi:pimeloyl-ACP methyl ester carboxylesterase